MTARFLDEPSTHRSLLDRARAGDDEAWQQWVLVYGPVVYRWLRRCGLQPADASDVMQETFLAVAKALATFNAESRNSSFRGWLWTITKNKLRDHHRAAAGEVAAAGDSVYRRAIETQAIRSAKGSMNEPDSHTSPATAIDPPGDLADDLQSIRRRVLETIRTSIHVKTWQMFWRTAVDGCDASDVAEEFEVTRWTVYKAKARVLHRLQNEMRGLE